MTGYVRSPAVGERASVSDGRWSRRPAADEAIEIGAGRVRSENLRYDRTVSVVCRSRRFINRRFHGTGFGSRGMSIFELALDRQVDDHTGAATRALAGGNFPTVTFNNQVRYGEP